MIGREPRTYGEVCRELRDAGYTNLWSLAIWDKLPPITIDDRYIKERANRAADYGDWDIADGNVVVFVRRSDKARFRIYRAA